MASNEQSTDDGLLENSKRLFDAGVDEVDIATRARLRAVRQRALREAASPAWVRAPRVWLPAAAAATLLVILAPRLVEHTDPELARNFGTVAVTDLEILLGEEELEMLADFEFYEWLDLQDVGSSESQIEDGVG
jgi:hypothetical protein